MNTAAIDTVIRVREAAMADAAWLADCASAMALETEGKRLHPEVVRAGVEAGLADPARARYFIAMHDAHAGKDTLGAPAGTLMFTHEWSDWRNGDWWWIQSVYVLPAGRWHGVFSALYRHVQGLARATDGVIGLRLNVEHANAAAQATYRALGMRDAGYRVYEAAL